MSKTILYLDPWTGISGDMLLASLLDTDRESGRLEEEFRRVVPGLGLAEAEVEVVRDKEWGLACTRVRVVEKSRPPLRHLADMEDLIRSASLSKWVRERALAAVRRLARVEAEVHGCALEEVHFHEVGAVDTLVDVVGAFVLVEALGIHKVMVGPVPVGGGYVEIEHGRMVVPAPATVRLLQGYEIVGGPEERELTTPTGALLLRELGAEQGPIPAMSLERLGYGAGSVRLEGGPNVLRALVGTAAQEGALDSVVELETNLDDVSPEVVGHAVQRLRETGALEVWTVPAFMKKDRPAVVLHVLTRAHKEPVLVDLLFAETGTLGVRRRIVSRYVAEREETLVQVAGCDVRVKWGRWADGRVSFAPEYEDAVRASAATGLPLREIMSLAWEKARWSEEERALRRSQEKEAGF